MSDELSQLSVAALRERFADQAPQPAELAALQNDARAGVRALARTFVNRQQRLEARHQDMLKRLRYEQALWDRGLVYVAGCDEAGMGPLAGPVVAAAAILRREDPIEGVDDSKLLDPEERDRLAVEIRARAVAWAIGLATHEEIDAINIRQAGMLAMQRALEGLRPVPQHVLLDAREIQAFPVPQTPIIRGDSLSVSIGAASILAKTHRDALMVAADAQYPGYGFAIHKGYPVPMHLEALRRLGACEIHRRTFAPVRDVIEQRLRQLKLFER